MKKKIDAEKELTKAEVISLLQDANKTRTKLPETEEEFAKLKQANGKLAYLQLVKFVKQRGLQTKDPRLYRDLNVYLFEAGYGKAGLTQEAGRPSTPVSINFIAVNSKKELEDLKGQTIPLLKDATINSEAQKN